MPCPFLAMGEPWVIAAVGKGTTEQDSRAALNPERRSTAFGRDQSMNNGARALHDVIAQAV